MALVSSPVTVGLRRSLAPQEPILLVKVFHKLATVEFKLAHLLRPFKTGKSLGGTKGRATAKSDAQVQVMSDVDTLGLLKGNLLLLNS